jgi:hypothetical protein
MLVRGEHEAHLVSLTFSVVKRRAERRAHANAAAALSEADS